ncbi:ABC transporter ATP-binding protein [Frankia sp. CH37]|nr:ABC transporter ATP-binding protein [Parafrankia sp. CH37]
MGSRRPGRRVAALAVLGLLAGAGEFLLIVLVVRLPGGDSRLGSFLPDRLTSDRAATAAAALAVTAFVAGVHVASARTATRTGVEALGWARGRLLDHYLAAPYLAQRAEPTGRLQELVLGEASQVAFGAQRAAEAVAAALNIAALTALALAISPVATGALLGVVAVTATAVRRARRHSRALAARAVAASSALAESVTETTTITAELRVFGVTASAQHLLFDQAGHAGAEFGRMQLRVALTPLLGRDLGVAMMIPALLAVLALRDLRIETLGVTIVLALRSLGQASSLVAAIHQLDERGLHLDRIDDHLRRWRDPRPPVAGVAHPGAARCQPGAGRLRMEAVAVTYPGADRPALRDIDLELRPGERLGVVGRSGAGKSTLAGVLLGLLAPDRGRVLVDGVDRSTIDPAGWFRRVATVTQQPAMITGTVAENIRFLRAGIPDAALREAALAAGLAADLARWPDGLDHPAGVHGSRVSGGQRQRIALARALAGAPDLLVLDEPSSALDAHAEQALRAALAALGPRTTVLIIAHRLSTVLDCDRLAVLDGGRMVALGSPAELAGTDGYFRDALALSEVALPSSITVSD